MYDNVARNEGDDDLSQILWIYRDGNSTRGILASHGWSMHSPLSALILAKMRPYHVDAAWEGNLRSSIWRLDGSGNVQLWDDVGFLHLVLGSCDNSELLSTTEKVIL